MPSALARRRMMRGGVLPEKGIGGQPARLAASGAEEIAIDVIGDAGRFDVFVQTLIETVMTGNVVFLAAFSCKRIQRRRPWTK